LEWHKDTSENALEIINIIDMKIMSINIYQIVVVVISALMIFQGFRRFIKRKEGQTILKLLIRIAVWGGMAIITIFPRLIHLMAKTLGIIDNMNAVILTGFLLVFLMIFKLLSAIERLEQQISEVTRKEALKDVKKNN
jgi:hypothetical protein